ncbi:hypothetical protein SPSYN_01740 [Sporotomaculum syntrophicum]|uniref:Uncharacterized protein n=1 Tax=Sporotomaculum syntrophicum TaxID=182264 RepID=A0A9D2WS45_9FIRM|nr:hypothetical protein SPSYN_01740 [Sporotomaculum syntrophicum]
MAYGGTSSSFILFLILILLVFGMGFCGYGVADVKE